MAEVQRTAEQVRPGDVVVQRVEVATTTFEADGRVTIAYVGGGAVTVQPTDAVTLDDGTA